MTNGVRDASRSSLGRHRAITFDAHASLRETGVEILRELARDVERRYGLFFGDSRAYLLCRGVASRMAKTGERTADGYRQRLASSADEAHALSELLVNSETRFFRQATTFSALREVVLPTLRAESARRGSPLRLLSAGCATGEEAFSLALCAKQARAAAFEVVGLDLSRAALRQAAGGRYPVRRCRGIEAEERQLFDPAPPAAAELCVRGSLRSSVSFVVGNLVALEGLPLPPQDVILCQNVLIYFRREYRVRTLLLLRQRLACGGYLILGPGEGIGMDVPGLRSIRLDDCVVYRKE